MDSTGTSHSTSTSSSSIFSRNMPSNVLHTVKRSLSLSRKPEPAPPSYYVGSTAEENVFNLTNAPPQQPLRAPPTFQQIASGLAVRQPRPRDTKPIADPPRRPSLKKPSDSLFLQPHPHPQTAPASSSSFVKLRRVSSSSPSPGLGTSSVISSSSSATTSTSSASRTVLPAVARVTKHKLSLSFSALTRGGKQQQQPQTSSSVSSLEGSTKKAVRFTDSPEPASVASFVSTTTDEDVSPVRGLGSSKTRVQIGGAAGAGGRAPMYAVAFPGRRHQQ